MSTHDTTSARTPAAYSKSLSNPSAVHKRSQLAQRRSPFAQRRLRPSHIRAGSRVAHTPSRLCPELLTAFTSSAETCTAAAAQEQRKRSRSGVHQVASSSNPTASVPHLRGSSYDEYRPRTTLRMDCSIYRSRESELKRKTSVATAPLACGHRQRVHGSATVQDTRSTAYRARGTVRDTSRPAAMYNEEHYKSSNSDNASDVRTFAACAKSDFVLGEEHSLSDAPRAQAYQQPCRNCAAFGDSA
ncbi:hypothetical protein EDB83DRAFT_2532748 [Lactarius deliciosus]|nr:hypothetical protein EDB83DRAFT_2532748 [Lactarius deliciosus]